MATIFELRGVTKSFDGRPLLDGLDLKLDEGEALGIVGPSGAGKSVTIKMLTGLQSPDDGTVLYRGEDISEFNNERLRQLRGEVGYLFQSGALFDSLSVLDNVTYALREHTDMGDEAMRARAEECIEQVGLETRVLDLFPAALSGGMRKRVALARTIAIKPKVILYDDPMEGLDPKSVTRIGRLLRRLRTELNLTMVLVSHDMRTVFSVCDRVVLLKERRIQCDGATATAIEHSEALRTFVGTALHSHESGLLSAPRA